MLNQLEPRYTPNKSNFFLRLFQKFSGKVATKISSQTSIQVIRHTSIQSKIEKKIKNIYLSA